MGSYSNSLKLALAGLPAWKTPPLTNPLSTRRGKEQPRVSGGGNMQLQKSSIGSICHRVQGKSQGAVPREKGGFN